MPVFSSLGTASTKATGQGLPQRLRILSHNAANVVTLSGYNVYTFNSATLSATFTTGGTGTLDFVLVGGGGGGGSVISYTLPGSAAAGGGGGGGVYVGTAVPWIAGVANITLGSGGTGGAGTPTGGLGLVGGNTNISVSGTSLSYMGQGGGGGGYVQNSTGYAGSAGGSGGGGGIWNGTPVSIGAGGAGQQLGGLGYPGAAASLPPGSAGNGGGAAGPGSTGGAGYILTWFTPSIYLGPGGGGGTTLSGPANPGGSPGAAKGGTNSSLAVAGTDYGSGGAGSAASTAGNGIQGVAFVRFPLNITAPSTPTLIDNVSVATTTSATIYYTASATSGGSPILSYTAVSTPGGITGTDSTNQGYITVSGLTTGVSYTFQVYATNAVGNSLYSNTSSSVLIATAPSAPTITTISNTEYTLVTVYWTASANANGTPITSYTAIATPGGLSTTVSAATTSAVISGLTPGLSYNFQVYATNAKGSTYSSTVPLIASAPIMSATITGPSGTASTYINGGNTFTIFSGNGTLTVTQTYRFDLLLVAGGGGGANDTPTNYRGGGGGAGGVVWQSNVQLDSGSYSLTVGPGGSINNPGGNSAFVQTTGGSYTSTAIGGGKGGAGSGGSGGGGTGSNNPTFATPAGPGTPGQGFGGGNGGAYAAGGGGGAAGAGVGSVKDVFNNWSNGPGGPGTTAYNSYFSNAGISVTAIAGGGGGGGAGGGTGYNSYGGGGIGAAAGVGVTAGQNGIVVIRALPLTVPDAPTIGTATAGAVGSSIVYVNYTPPVFTGGRTITSYTAVSSPGGYYGIDYTLSGNITVSGLPVDTYTFTVYATNAIGNSTVSGTSNSVPLVPFISNVTGGSLTTSGINTIATFSTVGTSTGSFTVNGTLTGNVLVVAGGGGGGSNGGGGLAGGGGAGGLVYRTGQSFTSGTYTVTVGNGGTTGNPGGAQPGGNSVITGPGAWGNITGIGGGRGGDNLAGIGGAGGNGGSGGGAYNGGPTYPAGIGQQPSSASGGFGNNGGGFPGGWGGGGAGGGVTSTAGGAGLSINITGSNYTYSQGGAGSSTPVGGPSTNYGQGGNGANGGFVGRAGYQGIIVISYLTNG